MFTVYANNYFPIVVALAVIIGLIVAILGILTVCKVKHWKLTLTGAIIGLLCLVALPFYPNVVDTTTPAEQLEHQIGVVHLPDHDAINNYVWYGTSNCEIQYTDGLEVKNFWFYDGDEESYYIWADLGWKDDRIAIANDTKQLAIKKVTTDEDGIHVTNFDKNGEKNEYDTAWFASNFIGDAVGEVIETLRLEDESDNNSNSNVNSNTSSSNKNTSASNSNSNTSNTNTSTSKATNSSSSSTSADGGIGAGVN